MKLIHKNNDLNLSSSLSLDDDVVNLDLMNLSDNLRLIEESFYKVFDLNPCPMAISKLETGELIDVNESFVNIIGIETKYHIIGKLSSEKGLRIIKDHDRNKIISQIEKNGQAKNVFVKFNNINGKKLKGLFSASIIELNNIKCLLTICQIVDRKCAFSFFVF